MPSTGLSLKRYNTCYHPHTFNEPAMKGEKWNGKPRVECGNGRHPPSKTPVGALPWTGMSEATPWFA